MNNKDNQKNNNYINKEIKQIYIYIYIYIYLFIFNYLFIYLLIYLQNFQDLLQILQVQNLVCPQKSPPRVRLGGWGVHPDPKNRQESDSGLKKAPEALKSQKIEFFNFRKFRIIFFRFLTNLEHYEQAFSSPNGTSLDII